MHIDQSSPCLVKGKTSFVLQFFEHCDTYCAALRGREVIRIFEDVESAGFRPMPTGQSAKEECHMLKQRLSRYFPEEAKP